MPDSEYPVREVLDLPDAPGVTEVLFPDVSQPNAYFGVVSSQGDDHVAGVHVLYGGRHRLVLLDADDAAAAARRLLWLATSPDDKRARAAMRWRIDTAMISGASSTDVVDDLLEHFEVFPRAAE